MYEFHRDLCTSEVTRYPILLCLLQFNSWPIIHLDGVYIGERILDLVKKLTRRIYLLQSKLQSAVYNIIYFCSNVHNLVWQ